MVYFATKTTAASCLLALASTINGQNVTSDTYFYGQSPEVLPSRK
jgi:hypothetical protein